MNNTYRINASFAVAKAQDAVKNWKQGLALAEASQDADAIAFCRRNLQACETNLVKVRKDVKENWTAYL